MQIVGIAGIGRNEAWAYREQGQDVAFGQVTDRPCQHDVRHHRCQLIA